MPTSVRLDADSELLLARLARRSGRTKSGVLREALRRLAAAEEAGPAPEGPYALVADLLGIAEGGPPDLARRHREAFRDKLRRKARS